MHSSMATMCPLVRNQKGQIREDLDGDWDELNVVQVWGREHLSRSSSIYQDSVLISWPNMSLQCNPNLHWIREAVLACTEST